MQHKEQHIIIVFLFSASPDDQGSLLWFPDKFSQYKKQQSKVIFFDHLKAPRCLGASLMLKMYSLSGSKHWHYSIQEYLLFCP